MEQRKFQIPKHPDKEQQVILVEKPAKDSVWYLVIEPNKAVPLVNLKDSKSANDVLDAAA